jgi:hypothetical protein
MWQRTRRLNQRHGLAAEQCVQSREAQQLIAHHDRSKAL